MPRIPRYVRLLNNSEAALISAIEIYNKPAFGAITYNSSVRTQFWFSNLAPRPRGYFSGRTEGL